LASSTVCVVLSEAEEMDEAKSARLICVRAAEAVW
jgi:hypothetical protein